MSDQTQEQTGEITKIPIRLFCSRGGISAEQIRIYIYSCTYKKNYNTRRGNKPNQQVLKNKKRFVSLY